MHLYKQPHTTLLESFSLWNESIDFKSAEHNTCWTSAVTSTLAFLNRETEYKGLQLSLDQAASNKPSFTYSSPSNLVSDSRKASKSRVSRTKPKTRLSPYPHVSALLLEAYAWSKCYFQRQWLMDICVCFGAVPRLPH